MYIIIIIIITAGGKIDAAFIVYDTGLVDDHEIFQWPLGECSGP